MVGMIVEIVKILLYSSRSFLGGQELAVVITIFFCIVYDLVLVIDILFYS